jgi:hypothetical protein
MKKTTTYLIAVLLTSGSARAETVMVTDGDGNNYGNAMGLAIDFDSSTAAFADWAPDLQAGLSYTLDSISLRNASTTAGAVYLGIYSGYTAPSLSGFLGTSDNAVDFSTIASGDWLTFTFSGINITADSTVGSGSGMLYFAFQTDISAQAAIGTVRSIHRINGFETYPMTDYLATVLDSGNPGAFDTRAPEYQANLTVVPEPTGVGLIGLSSAALLFARRRSMA